MTNEEFDRLLEAFHVDREQAARRYEEVRRRLVQKFQGLGDIDPEELADQAFDRFAGKLARGTEVKNDSPEGFIIGIANNVFKERYRRQVSREILLGSHTGPTAEDPVDLGGEEEARRRKACLRRCLDRLTEEKRRLALAYYSGEDRIESRHRLAQALGLTPNALRIQAHRVRGKLEDCVRSCLGITAVPGPSGR